GAGTGCGAGGVGSAGRFARGGGPAARGCRRSRLSGNAQVPSLGGQWYADFTPTTDHEVVTLLVLAATPPSTAPTVQIGEPLDPPVRDEEIEVAAGGVALSGRLTVPVDAAGLVLQRQIVTSLSVVAGAGSCLAGSSPV